MRARVVCLLLLLLLLLLVLTLAPATQIGGLEYYDSGDLGMIRDGHLYVTGRAKELIISGGYNVYPREIEDVVRTHPNVEDVAVVGEADPEWGERVVAYAVTTAPLDLATLREAIGDALAPFKHPRALHRVDALPRNALGKVQKHRLRAGHVHSD